MAADGFEKISGRRIAGIAARCSNDQPEVIGSLWDRYDREGVAARLGGVGLYAVYFEYAGDFNAPYTLLLGQHVDDDAPLLEGTRDVFIEPGEYAVFDAIGQPPQSIFDAWSRVWNSDLQRTYRTDFEMYQGPQRASVFVGAWEGSL